MSLETIIVMLIFFALPSLISAAGPWLRKQFQEFERRSVEEAARQREHAAAPSRPASRPQPRESTPDRPTPAVQADEIPHINTRLAVSVHPSARARVTQPGLRDRDELRRSIVLMTALGPCRDADPY
jgi:hypothetical protein